MIAKNPDVAGVRPRLTWNGRDDFIIGIVGSLENHIDFARREARQREVILNVDRADLLKFKLEDLKIPSGIERDLLSASRSAFFWAELSPSSVIVGTSARPSSLAARRRPWPAISTPPSSIKTGFVNPNSWIDRTSWSICRLG